MGFCSKFLCDRCQCLGLVHTRLFCTVVVAGGARVTAAQALKRPDVTAEALVASGVLDPCLAHEPEDLRTLETEVRYEGYLRRQEAEVEWAKKKSKEEFLMC